MWLICLCASFSLIVHLEAKSYGAGVTPPKEEYGYCYDCHYDPDAEKEAYDSPQAGRYPGYPKCALDGTIDEGRVDRWPCKTGKCFIRRDPNGLVYRGCADPMNLPWGVDDSLSCEYQGQKPSLWWFCDGDKCNGGNFGNGDICPDPPAVPYDINDDAYVETVHSPVDSAEGYPGEGEGYAGKSYGQESYGTKSYKQEPPRYEPPKSEKSYGNGKKSGYGQPSEGYGKKSGYGSKGKEARGGVDIYGVYTAEVAPLHPKKSQYPVEAPASDPWMNSGKKSYQEKPAYNKPEPKKSKSYKPEPTRKPTKSIEPKPHYKSEKPKPQYKQAKSVPHYKSVKSPDPPSKSVKSYQPPSKSYQPPSKSYQPPSKSYESPKKPAKSNQGSYKSTGNNYNKKPSTPELPPPAKKPSKSYKPKPLTQPVDYVHGLYNQEQQQQKQEQSYGIKDFKAYDKVKSSYDTQVEEGYNSFSDQLPPIVNARDNDYEPYQQQQPDLGYVPAESGAKSGYDAFGEDNFVNKNKYGKKDYGYNQGYGQGNSGYGNNGYDNSQSFTSNPCDGQCLDNPSGLFAHPQKDDWFIQCGNGMDLGKTCECCKPYYLRCPRGTTFDVSTRVCSRMTGDYASVQEPKSYKPVEY